MEDYLESIHLLISKKGYARPVDIASDLNLAPSSVTRMLQKLDEYGYVNYEKYRGIVLTSKGKKIAQAMVAKHQTLEEFLKIIGVDEEMIDQEIEQFKYHFSKQTSFCILYLVNFLKEHPEVLDAYIRYRNRDVKE